MSDRTPGPWTVAGDAMVYGPRFSIGDPNKLLGLVEVADCKGYKKERDANALLISAAPDLLALLCEVRDIGVLSCCCERPNGKCNGTCTATKIEAAIAKANGGAL